PLLVAGRVRRRCLETLMDGNRIQLVKPVCPRTHEDLRIGPIVVRAGQRGSMDVDLLRPLLRPKVEPRAAAGTEPPECAWAAFVVLDLSAPLQLLGYHAQEGGKGRGRGALTVGTVTDKIARGLTRIGPRHRTAHASAGKVI